MSCLENRDSRCFVDATRLYADEAILNQIDTTDAVLPA